MGLALALLAGCAEDSAPPTGPELQPLAVFEQSAAHYGAHARGRDEVPPNASRAQGQLLLRLSEDGTELHYKLIVANITNVTQSHIHLAPAGVNGPIVAWLYPSAPPAQLLPGRSDGVLATGTITAASLVGPLAGMPLEALISAIEAGTTYVNVHTQQFPPGEIRGQLP
ncbi:MAG TPA: CHRD domain-containing protein [Longimicrobiales bacterium]|nr:CHRD domain-containing protein [Longimicrobiales bacterium]